jgi:thiamine biosynthesis lipoprotein
MKRAVVHFLTGMLLAIVLGPAGGCNPHHAPVRTEWMSMSTFASFSLAGPEYQRLEEWTSDTRALLADVEKTLSFFQPDSELSRINQSASIGPIEASPMTTKLLAESVHFGSVTHGAFDITVSPLVRLWGFGGKPAPITVPSPDELVRRLSRVGYTHIQISSNTVYFNQPELTVNLGGIAKGFSVDLCFDQLRARGAAHFMMDLGGNIRCSGTPNGKDPWRIGVRNPFQTDEIVGVLELTDGMAVATSGNYERFVMIDNVRYSHIINPTTGYPVQGMASVSVLATNATQTDALSTGLFVAGIKEAIGILKQVPGSEAMMVPDSQPLQLYITPGFRKHFTPFKAYEKSIIILE